MPLSLAGFEIDVVVSEPFAENTYIVRKAGDRRASIVDPGFDPDAIIEMIRAADLSPELILLTHGHIDHIAGNEALKSRWPKLPIVIGRGDAGMLTDAKQNLSFLSGSLITSPPADRLLDDNETIEAAGGEWLVKWIPGHSPGHIVYISQGTSPTVVLGGDVLFAGSIGRSDFPGGNGPLLIAGIRNKLFSLPDDTVVLPGHGEPTTIGVERRSNPFCGDNAD
jgi:glyoxylase-like metal-dependent hydrolase (beta-lactamase superfamily II)